MIGLCAWGNRLSRTASRLFVSVNPDELKSDLQSSLPIGSHRNVCTEWFSRHGVEPTVEGFPCDLITGTFPSDTVFETGEINVRLILDGGLKSVQIERRAYPRWASAGGIRIARGFVLYAGSVDGRMVGPLGRIVTMDCNRAADRIAPWMRTSFDASPVESRCTEQSRARTAARDGGRYELRTWFGFANRAEQGVDESSDNPRADHAKQVDHRVYACPRCTGHVGGHDLNSTGPHPLSELRVVLPCWGMIIALESLVGIWCVMGTSTWIVRATGFVAGASFAGTLHWLSMLDRSFTLVEVSWLTSAGVGASLWMACRAGFEIRRLDAVESTSRGMQFSIRQLMILTAILACVSRAIQWIAPPYPLPQIVVGFLSPWAMLGTRRPLLGLVALCIATLGIGFGLMRPVFVVVLMAEMLLLASSLAARSVSWIPDCQSRVLH